jgi:hypothetical protein
MKLHTVLTAADDNPLYRDFIPVFLKTWQRLFPGIHVIIIQVCNENTDSDHPNIIHFNAIPAVHPAFQSQCIRLLWPALVGKEAALSADDGVLVTDIDMIPMNTSYYTKTLESIGNDKFVCLRNVISHISQYPICYNAATPRTWKELFKVNGVDDIRAILTRWYGQTSYDGIHGGNGWSFDQTKLFQTANLWEQAQNRLNRSRLVLLNDQQTGFRRLDRSQADAIRDHLPTVIEMAKRGAFSDFHMLRPYSEHKETIERIVSAL